MVFRPVARIVLILTLITCLCAQESQKPGPKADAPAAQANAAEKPKLPAPPAQAATGRDPLNSVTEFSAIMTGALLGPPKDTQMYRSGNLLRDDMGAGYVVSDLTTGHSFSNYPKSNVCFTNETRYARAFPFVALIDAQMEHTPASKEVVDGHPCQIEDVTITLKDGKVRKLKVWEAEDLKGFPLQIELEGRKRPSRVLFKDVKLGAPDPSLFKRPEDCAEAPKLHSGPTPAPPLASPEDEKSPKADTPETTPKPQP
jgi:hypothetical protein